MRAGEWQPYHDEGPLIVNNPTLGQRRAVGVDDPEERRHSRLGTDLTLDVDVLLAEEGLC